MADCYSGPALSFQLLYTAREAGKDYLQPIQGISPTGTGD